METIPVMKTITATELARNLSEILDRMAVDQEEVVIERNHRQVARLVPGPGLLTALEAMADLYQTLPEEAAKTWEADSRASSLKGQRLPKGVRNPWDS
jgi:antitoxin (DNA-binding transcriptional repressor) of toxin-antitoxin stability system